MRRLFRYSLILALCGLFTLKFTLTVGAQEAPLPPLEPLTPSNASRLEMLAEFGTGVLTEAFAWSPDSTALAIGGTTGIRIYNPHDFDTPPQFLPTTGMVTQVGYSPDGRYLGYIVDERLYMLELATKTLRGKPRKAEVFAFSPDGALVVIGRFGDAPGDGRTWGSVLEVRDFRYMRLLKTLLVTHTVSSFGIGSAREVIFSPDGTYLAAAWMMIETIDSCGLEYTEVRYWRVEDVLTLPETMLNSDAYVARTRLDDHFQVAFHPTENNLLSIDWPDYMGATDYLTALNPLHPETKSSFALEEMSSMVRDSAITSSFYSYFTDIAFSLNSGFLAGIVVSDRESIIHLMDVSRNAVVTEWPVSTALNTIGFSPDGAFMVGANAHELWIWREDGALAARLGMPKPEHSFDYPFRSAAAPDGSAFITYDLDNQAHLWQFDAEQGAFVQQPVPENYRVWDDESILRWRKEWIEVNPSDELTEPAQIAANIPEGGDFSPDGSRVIIGSFNQGRCGSDVSDLTMYNAQTGQALARIGLGASFGAYGLGFGSAVFTPDSRLLLASNDYRGYIFDAVTGEEIAAFPKLTNSRLTISADGTRLIAARRDGYVSVWGVSAP